MGCYCSKPDTQHHQTPVENIEQREEVITAFNKHLRAPENFGKRKRSSFSSSSQGPDPFSGPEPIRGLAVSVSRSNKRDPCISSQNDYSKYLMETSDSPIPSDVSTPMASCGFSAKDGGHLYE